MRTTNDAGRRAARLFACCAAALWALFSVTGAVAQAWKPERNVELIIPGGAGGGQDRTARILQKIMQNDCAVYRTGKTLAEGVAKIRDVYGQRHRVKVEDRSLIWNSDLVETLELDNLMYQALVSIESALNREESRGAQAREDFPDRNDEKWMKHTISWIDEAGKVTLDYRPVHMTTLSNDVQVFPPKARVY